MAQIEVHTPDIDIVFVLPALAEIWDVPAAMEQDLHIAPEFSESFAPALSESLIAADAWRSRKTISTIWHHARALALRKFAEIKTRVSVKIGFQNQQVELPPRNCQA